MAEASQIYWQTLIYTSRKQQTQSDINAKKSTNIHLSKNAESKHQRENLESSTIKMNKNYINKNWGSLQNNQAEGPTGSGSPEEH